jgi:hypothetical protein
VYGALKRLANEELVRELRTERIGGRGDRPARSNRPTPTPRREAPGLVALGGPRAFLRMGSLFTAPSARV